MTNIINRGLKLISYSITQKHSSALQAFGVLSLLWYSLWTIVFISATYLNINFYHYADYSVWVFAAFMYLLMDLLFCAPLFYIQVRWVRRVRRIASEAEKWSQIYYQRAQQQMYENPMMQQYGQQVSPNLQNYPANQQFDQIRQIRIQTARNCEAALRYEAAAQIYEEIGLWSEAGRVRMKAIELQAPKSFFTAHNIHIGNSTTIQDSIINRSQIGDSYNNPPQIPQQIPTQQNFQNPPRP